MGGSLFGEGQFQSITLNLIVIINRSKTMILSGLRILNKIYVIFMMLFTTTNLLLVFSTILNFTSKRKYTFLLENILGGKKNKPTDLSEIKTTT